MRNTFWKQDTYMKDTLTPKSDAKICDYDYVCTSMPVTHLPLPGTYPYQIILTDTFKTYVVAWSCQNSGDGHDEILWILTKERNSAAAVSAKKTAVDKLKTITGFLVHESYLGDTNQSGCTGDEEGIRTANGTSTV